jgi:GTP cyclohydrolase II
VDAIANYRNALLGTPNTGIAIAQETNADATSVELLAECEVPIARDGKYLGMWTLRYVMKIAHNLVCSQYVRCYKDSEGLTRHAVLIKGSPSQWKINRNEEDYVYTRIHSECFTSHVLGSQRCDCSKQLDLSLELIDKRGSGVSSMHRERSQHANLTK